MRSCLAALLLAIACATVHPQGDVIEVPVDAGWGATPGWAPNDAAVEYDHTFRDGFATFRAWGGGRVMIWARNEIPRLDVSRMRYVTLRYRLTNTDATLGSYLLYLATGDSPGMYSRNLAFGADALIHDGQWHTATTTMHPYGEIGTLALRFRALEGEKGRLDVAYLRFSAKPPLNSLDEVIDWSPGHAGIAGTLLELGPLRETSLADVQAALDLSDWFSDESVTVEGINFRVPMADPAALSTPKDGTHSATVPVGETGAALYLLLGASFPYQMLNYAGWGPGDSTDRPEQFRVAIRYADGAREEQVPYCLRQARHGMWRGLQAYALPLVAGKEVTEISLCDGMRTSAFHLIAATVAQECLVPSVPDAPVRTPPGVDPPPVPPSLELRGDRLTIRNRSGRLHLSLGPEGLSLTRASNAYNPDCSIRIRVVPLFEVRAEGEAWTSEAFELAEPVSVQGTQAEISLVCTEARLAARLGIEVRDDETAFRLQLTNLADESRRLDVICPRTRLTTPDPADLWYFYPSMCPAWSNADHVFEMAYSGKVPVQFMDAYDRARGGGIYVGTRDRSLRQRYYDLKKRGDILDVAIRYQHNPPLAAGETVEYPEAVIALHAGDWKPAFAAYRRWLDSWCRPARPRLDWYRRVWNFRTYWTHTMGDGRAEWNLLNPETQQYQTEAFLEKDFGLFGDVDMAHIFDWRISEEYGRYGDFSHYDDLGGLEQFRGMIRTMQDHDVRVGLYLDCYLCSRKSLIGQAHGEEWALRKQDGRIGDNYSTDEDPMYNMCVLHPGWQDYLAETCARVAHETGCDGIYLDEGMTDYGAYWCWSDKHGHPAPGVNQLGLIELSRKVREALPEGVALYAEWVPPDVFIPYLDGAYQASLRLSDAELSPGYLQLPRFAFPDFKVLTISNGGSMYDGIWEGMKFSLFNGVPLYTLSWGHDEDSLPLIRKMSGILHEHEDAFLTSRPEPYVETERNRVFANEFPGARETVWTLWNGRYRTVAGPLLKVKHVRGARYMDLWHDQELQPVIADGMAVIETTLGPRGIGVVARVRRH